MKKCKVEKAMKKCKCDSCIQRRVVEKMQWRMWVPEPKREKKQNEN